MKSKWFIHQRIEKEYFIKVCKDSQSMAQAASVLNLHFNSFKKRALELGCYFPNQSGLGILKRKSKIPIEDIIFKGLYPYYQSYKLKKRLIKEGLKTNECENCQIQNWQGKVLQMELHHIDGDRTNHSFENLTMLCPNCHSQTDTFRSKNRKI